MKTRYFVQATGIGNRLPEALDDFKTRFGTSLALSVEDIPLGVNIVFDYDSGILAKAQEWAKSFPFVRVRDHYIRTFDASDCRKGDLCTLNFANCYLWPQETKWATCSECGGNIEISTGVKPNRLEFKHGIGQWSSSLFLSRENAQIVENSGLVGFETIDWEPNPRYKQLRPALFLDELVIEGVNAVDCDGTVCAKCGRPDARFFLGPTHLRLGDYDEQDFVGTRFMEGESLCFSQRATSFLKREFRAVRYWEPVYFGTDP